MTVKISVKICEEDANNHVRIMWRNAAMEPINVKDRVLKVGEEAKIYLYDHYDGLKLIMQEEKVQPSTVERVTPPLPDHGNEETN